MSFDPHATLNAMPTGSITTLPLPLLADLPPEQLTPEMREQVARYEREREERHAKWLAEQPWHWHLNRRVQEWRAQNRPRYRRLWPWSVTIHRWDAEDDCGCE